MHRVKVLLQRFLPYVAAGGIAGMAVFAVDAVEVTRDGALETSSVAWWFLWSLHLTWGLALGLLAGGVGLALIGPADAVTRNVRAFLWPGSSKRQDAADLVRLQHGVSVLLGVCLTSAAFFVSWLVSMRCFSFNNVPLAGLLLVLLVYFIHLTAFVVYRRLRTGFLSRFGEVAFIARVTRPDWIVLLFVGLAFGAGLGGYFRFQTALSETWEAVNIAPLVGICGIGLAAYVGEVVLRRMHRVSTTVLVAMISSLAIGLWQSGSQAWTGADNLRLHETRCATATLTVLERLSDRDGDGFSGGYGHGDCDDSDPTAWPGSSEGDDCSGGSEVKKISDVELERLMGGAVPTGAKSASRATDGAPVVNRSTFKPTELDGPPIEPPPEVAVNTRVSTTDGSKDVPPLIPAPPSEGDRPPRPMNIVLITVDTLRADHCSFQGYERETTPNLDAFAKTAAVFERAYAPSNMTPISIPAMLSGRYTSELFRDDAHFIRFSEKNTFLAERLQSLGYETRGVLTHWYFEPKKRSGLNQGFEHWEVVGTKWGKAMEGVSTSELVSAEGLRQLEQTSSDRPWFLWFHFLDPHKWYIEHPGFEPKWGRSSRDRYDHEIAFTDHHIGVLLERLKTMPAWNNTAVFITSDHGEAFGEHKTHFHGFSMYEDQLRVPFIARVPGRSGVRVKKRVGLIDLAPTILELAGGTQPQEMSGRSLLPEIRGASVPQRLIYAERTRGPHSAGHRALIHGDHKLVWRAAGNRYELYDLARDPTESSDILSKESVVASRMKSILKGFLSGVLDSAGKVVKVR